MSLKDFRKKCQLTQQGLAKSIGVNRSTYTMWERGKTKPPLNKIYALAIALNVSVVEIVNYLLGDTTSNDI